MGVEGDCQDARAGGLGVGREICERRGGLGPEAALSIPDQALTLLEDEAVIALNGAARIKEYRVYSK